MIVDDELRGELTSVFATLKHLKILLAFKKLPSTNDFALALEKTGQACGTVVIAAEQTNGHGRMKRQWQSLCGDIMMSVILRPGAMPAELFLLPILPGLAMVDALKDLGVKVCLKWPNDIVFCDAEDGPIFDYFGPYRKMGGILVENIFKNNEINACVMGLGLNIKVNPELASLVPHCGFLGELNNQLGKALVLAKFLVRLDGIIERARCQDFVDDILADYMRHCATLGHRIAVMQGNLKITGEAIGVGRDGALLVKEGTNIHKVYAGDVQRCSR